MGEGRLPDVRLNQRLARMVEQFDLTRTAEACRSFQRLIHAVEELLTAMDPSLTTVTPLLPPDAS